MENLNADMREVAARLDVENRIKAAINRVWSATIADMYGNLLERRLVIDAARRFSPFRVISEGKE